MLSIFAVVIAALSLAVAIPSSSGLLE